MKSPQTILDSLQHLAILTHRQSDIVLQEQLGIGMSQYRILQVLQTNPTLQQKQIAGLLGQTEASISRQVRLMQDRMMVSARVNPENRREHLTTLLPKGQRLLEAGAEVLASQHQGMVTGLSRNERDVLTSLLSKLHGNVCLASEAEGIVHV